MIKELSRASASKLTLGTQGASVLLLVAAGAVFAFGLPERERPATTLPVSITGRTAGTTGPETAGPSGDGVRQEPLKIDMGGLAARLSMIDNAPEPPEPETPDEPVLAGEEPGPDDGVPPQPFASRVRYLGMIEVGRSSMAFVNIDGTQRVVREGSVVQPMKERPEYGPLTIEAITASRITVSHEDGSADIGLSQREGPAITMVAGGEIERVGTERTELEQPRMLGQFETNTNGDPLPAAEIDRRRRAIERQRNRQPRNPDAQTAGTRRAGALGANALNRARDNQRRPQREQNTGGDE